MRKICCVAIAFFLILGMINTVNASTDTKTKYPILLVPGVLGFDSLLGIVDYFYGIEDFIERDSGGQDVHLIGLAGWQNTYERGVDLADQIEAYCRAHSCAKVNLIAHSHGSTTSRVAMKIVPNRIASLTTIAGPHYGTPTADCAKEFPAWLQNLAYAGIDLFMGNFVALLYSDWTYVGENNTVDVINDFTQHGMEIFNEHIFKCAGVPPGGSYGTKSYGADATGPGSLAGDGLGHAMSPSNPNAILFYSWTGNIGHRYLTNIFDPVDTAMFVTNKLNELYGYYGDADAFIPVSSAKFGKVLGTNYSWNHGDEINHMLGLIGWGAANPKVVFWNHANRLKNAQR